MEMLQENRVHTAVFAKKTQVAPDMFQVDFLLKKPLKHEVGQYAWIQLPFMKYKDVKGDRRAMSILSKPGSKMLSVLFSGKTSGYKKSLLSLKKSSKINVIGPFGMSFCLPEKKRVPLVLIAESGKIAPFLALIRHTPIERLKVPITFICISPSPEALFFKKEISALEKRNPLAKGMVTKKLPSQKSLRNFRHLKNSLFFINGSQALVDHVHQLLKKMGMGESQMRFESFYPTPPNKDTLNRLFEKIKLRSKRPSIHQEKCEVLLSAIENSSNHTIITDINGKVIFANKAAEKMTGYTLEEMKGNTPRLWGGMMSRRFYKSLWQTKIHGRSLDREIVNRRKNGMLYRVMSHISPIKDNKGELIGYISTEEDITKIRHAEARLREKSRKLTNIIEGTNVGTWEWNVQTGETNFSKKWAELIGYTLKELSPLSIQTWIKLTHPDDLKKSDESLRKHFSGKADHYECEARMRHKNGGWVWVLARGKVIEWTKDGKPLWMYGTHTDITAQKKAEKKMLEAKNRLELATHSAKIGIWEWNLVTDKIIWNDQMYGLYGKQKEKFIPTRHSWKNCLHPEDRKQSEKDFEKLFKKKAEINHQFRFIWPDGTERWIQTHGKLICDKKGLACKMVGVNWDITSEKEVDKAKSEFVSLASHQLRTPLSAINWYTEMLMAGDAGPINEEQKKYLTEIYQGNQRMTDLVNALLNVSRIELGTFAIDPKPTDIVAASKDIVMGLESKIFEKKLGVKEKYDKNIPLLKVDPGLFRMVMENLLSNAVKYTPEGGHIEYCIKNRRKEVLLSVKDSGYGIPKDQQSKLFSKLFRADNVREKAIEGTGLGLYIVKKVVNEAGGKIWFESEEGKGSCFYVSLPKSGFKKKEGTRALT